MRIVSCFFYYIYIWSSRPEIPVVYSIVPCYKFFDLIYCFFHLYWGLLCWKNPVSNLGFCSVAFDFWSVKSLEEKRFFRGDLYFLMSSWSNLDLFCFNFWQYIFLSNKVGIVLWWFYVHFSCLCDWNIERFQGLCPRGSLGKLDQKTTSCKACNKFKLHFSSSLSEGKTQSSY